MKITIELTENEVTGIKAYLKDVDGVKAGKVSMLKSETVTIDSTEPSMVFGKYFNTKDLPSRERELELRVIELEDEVTQLILHAEEDTLTYSVLEHARKLIFKP